MKNDKGERLDICMYNDQWFGRLGQYSRKLVNLQKKTSLQNIRKSSSVELQKKIHWQNVRKSRENY